MTRINGTLQRKADELTRDNPRAKALLEKLEGNPTAYAVAVAALEGARIAQERRAKRGN